MGRRLAERFERGEGVADGVDFDALGGLDSNVIEAASLAHDLGHPPFGHVGGDTLGECALSAGAADGFEGNAQTFRIVTRLGVVTEPPVGQKSAGLDLSRATQNAVLKYPWTANRRHDLGSGEKFGVYDSDNESLEWAREGGFLADSARSLEAEIMDWADDIAYAVHDVEDFYRAGLIPTHRLARLADDERTDLMNAVTSRWENKFGAPPNEAELRAASDFALPMLPTQPFRPTVEARAALRQGTSALIHRFILGTHIGPTGLEIDRQIAIEVMLLKQLTRHFVIRNAALATQQVGQRRIVRELFETYFEATQTNDYAVFPAGAATGLRSMVETSPPSERARLVADVVATMTEVQAVKLHRRMTGTDLGAFLDPSVT